MSTTANDVSMQENLNPNSQINSLNPRETLAFLMAQNSNPKFVNSPSFPQEYNQNNNQFQPQQIFQPQTGEISQNPLNLNLPAFPKLDSNQSNLPTQVSEQPVFNLTKEQNPNPIQPQIEQKNEQTNSVQIPSQTLETKKPIVTENKTENTKRFSLFGKIYQKLHPSTDNNGNKHFSLNNLSKIGKISEIQALLNKMKIAAQKDSQN